MVSNYIAGWGMGDVLTDAWNNATTVHSVLKSVGIPEPAASYALYQAYHETGAFKSPLYTQHNNASGIKFAGQAGAVKGNNGYAYFNTLKDWANSLRYEISKGSAPIKATTLEDYVQRLKQNRYFEDSTGNYESGMKRARLVLKSLPAEMRAGPTNSGPTADFQQPADKDIPGSIDYAKKENEAMKKMWSDLPLWAKIAAAAAGVVLVKKLLD